ncbi:hypothetical protein [Miltoncostaea oceani]|uniref:hypothetical protein n=1 Tax=Miltoncostaea oceani TaxID=2843216 RepID=UPI001C3D21FE|nr:hypothetical protein [Miltoncostaea oceani]
MRATLFEHPGLVVILIALAIGLVVGAVRRIAALSVALLLAVVIAALFPGPRAIAEAAVSQDGWGERISCLGAGAVSFETVRGQIGPENLSACAPPPRS